MAEWLAESFVKYDRNKRTACQRKKAACWNWPLSFLFDILHFLMLNEKKALLLHISLIGYSVLLQSCVTKLKCFFSNLWYDRASQISLKFSISYSHHNYTVTTNGHYESFSYMSHCIRNCFSFRIDMMTFFWSKKPTLEHIDSILQWWLTRFGHKMTFFEACSMKLNAIDLSFAVDGVAQMKWLHQHFKIYWINESITELCTPKCTAILVALIFLIF